MASRFLEAVDKLRGGRKLTELQECDVATEFCGLASCCGPTGALPADGTQQRSERLVALKRRV